MSERLRLFFTQLESKVLDLLENEDLLVIQQHNLLSELVQDNFSDYYEIISKYSGKAREYGYVSTNLLTDYLQDEVNQVSTKAKIYIDLKDLVKSSPKVNRIIEIRNFQASQNTINRVDNQINQVLQEGYNKGWGVDGVSKEIQKNFKGFKEWEANRIARTEINSSKNEASYYTLREDGLEYHQWLTAGDERVRSTHSELDGLITSVGNPFPNGLLYPGDTNGAVAEFINCRCTDLPYILPYDMMVPPGMTTFKESDLVPITYTKTEDFSRMELYNIEDTITVHGKETLIHSRLGIKHFNVTEYTSRDLIIGQPKGRVRGFITNDEILQGYDRLPKQLQDEIKKIYVFNDVIRDSTGKVILGQASPDNKLINFYISNRRLIDYQTGVLRHEAGHLITYRIDPTDYIKVMIKDAELNISRGKQITPSAYAENKGIIEDIPESFRVLLGEPGTFKKDFPYRYEYLKQFLL